MKLLLSYVFEVIKVKVHILLVLFRLLFFWGILSFFVFKFINLILLLILLALYSIFFFEINIFSGFMWSIFHLKNLNLNMTFFFYEAFCYLINLLNYFLLCCFWIQMKYSYLHYLMYFYWYYYFLVLLSNPLILIFLLILLLLISKLEYID